MIWILTEGEGNGIKSRLPFKVFSTLMIRYAIIISTDISVCMSSNWLLHTCYISVKCLKCLYFTTSFMQYWKIGDKLNLQSEIKRLCLENANRCKQVKKNISKCYVYQIWRTLNCLTADHIIRFLILCISELKGLQNWGVKWS